MDITPAIQYLQTRAIPFHVFQHSGPIHSLEQAAAERAERPEQVVRSIVFRLAAGDYVMVLMAGDQQVPWKSLRQYIGQSRLTMATEAELLEATGCRPGTVNPFGLPRPMRILIEQTILAQAEVSIGSGQRGLAILITPADLTNALDAYEIVDFEAS